MTEKEHGFTLIEIIIVIIIVGILAAVGISQYSNLVEKSRIAEAKIAIGAQRKLAYEYYMNNGTLSTVLAEDVGSGISCGPATYYQYWLLSMGANSVWLAAARCDSGGKTPNATKYTLYNIYYPGTDHNEWHCFYGSYGSGTSCFGYPP